MENAILALKCVFDSTVTLCFLSLLHGLLLNRKRWKKRQVITFDKEHYETGILKRDVLTDCSTPNWLMCSSYLKVLKSVCLRECREEERDKFVSSFLEVQIILVPLVIVQHYLELNKSSSFCTKLRVCNSNLLIWKIQVNLHIWHSKPWPIWHTVYLYALSITVL